MKHPITRNALIEEVENLLQQVYQWRAIEYTNVAYLENAVKYAHEAEAVLQFIEYSDCGSHGGFDNGHRGSPSLEQRLQWIKEKKKLKELNHEDD